MNAFNASINLIPSPTQGSSWNLNPLVIEGLRKNQTQIKRKRGKYYKNVKSLGGGTSVLNITRYKTKGKNTMRKRIVNVYILLLKKHVRITGLQCIRPYL